jgi:hypothetical protein
VTENANLCTYHRTTKEQVQVRMSTKDPTKHVWEPGMVQWCTHPKSPITYTKAMSFGGADMLQCNGCLAQCPITEANGDIEPKDLGTWVRGPEVRPE